MFIVLKKLFWFFWEQRTRYGIALLMLLILNFVEIAPPDLIGKAIDGMSQGTLTAHTLLVLLGIYAGLVVIMYTFGFTWQFYLFGGANQLQRTLRSRLMRHFLRMTPTFFEQNRTGDLMARATNDLNAVSQTAGFGILTLVDSTTFAGTILATMAALVSWKLTLLSLIPLPVMAFALTRYGKLVHERFVQAQDAFGDMNDRVLETIAGIRVVRAYVQEEAEECRFAQTTEDVYRKNVAVAKIDALFDPSIKLLIGITYLIGLGYGSYMVLQSQITLGQLTSFNIYLGMLIWPMLAVGELINIMQRGNASLDRVSETLAYPPDVADEENCRSETLPEVLEFRDYSFRYPLSSKNNLCNINLKIRRGETLGIVGRTGCGKTTLIKQLLREYPMGRGEFLVNGVSMKHITIAQVHGWLGYVPQDSMLFSRTVEENVRFGCSDATEAEILAALERAAFTKDLVLLQNGLQTLVGEKGIALSGGQKQRIALARALILDPEILILDDAISAVDARTEAKIVEAIRRDRNEKTTLIATHRLSAIEHANFIVVLDDGSIIEAGTHAELIAMGGWYKEQYDRQQAEDDEELGVMSR